MDSDSDSEFSFTPPELVEAAKEASSKLLPSKSRKIYENAYSRFMEWKAKKKSSSFSETVLLAYFSELVQQQKPSTVWSNYSMIRSTLQANNNVDISKYLKLITFLKQNAKGYRPKKSKIFTRTQINDFLNNAPDEVYLMTKVVVVFGIAGACRICEISQVTIDDIEDAGTLLVVKINQTKNDVSRRFIVTEEYVKFYRMYIALRPPAAKDRRLFYAYRNGKCINQVVGKNQFYKVPETVANFLCLENAKSYTGHAFRRSSATLLVESGGDLMTLKKHGGWKSSTIAEGYVDESVTQRTEIANKVLGTCGNGSAEVRPNLRPGASRAVVSMAENVISTEEISTVAEISNRPGKMTFMQCTFNNCNFNVKEM